MNTPIQHTIRRGERQIPGYSYALQPLTWFERLRGWIAGKEVRRTYIGTIFNPSGKYMNHCVKSCR